MAQQYFSVFPLRLFRISKSEEVLVQDIVRAIRIDPKLKINPMFFIVYRASDDESPEMISHKFYGTTSYHWIIMLLNEKFDPFSDFPKTDSVIRKFCEKKYSNILGTHHYEDENGVEVDEFNPGKMVVTNLEYETRRNETLRTVKVLKPEVISEFIATYQDLISR